MTLHATHTTAVLRVASTMRYAVHGYWAYCMGCEWHRTFMDAVDAERAAAAHAAREAGR